MATTFSDDTAGFTYDYSPAGRVLTAARVQNGGVSASSAYTYDAAGRTVSTVRTGPGGGGANYSYTSAGRLSGASWSTGMAVAYSYNQVGELTTVTPSGTGNIPAVTYAYDPSGRVSTVTREGPPSPTPSVKTTAAVYDAAGQLSSLQHSTTAGVVQAYAITRDTRGNPTQVDTTTSAGTTSALYTYDAVSRLRAECYPVSGDVCVAKSPRNAYTYDVVGNRATETARTVVGTKATTVVTDYTYDAAYQLLTESVAGTATVTNTWSANGALATSTTPTGTRTYTTDLTDELISLNLEDGSTVGYTHDSAGNRTSRTVDGLLDATWAWDDLSSLPMRIGEYDATGTLATGWLPDPTSSTGASLAQTSAGVSSWLLSDPFANTVATVSTTGNTVSGTRSMDAFGVQRTSATGSLADAAVGFAGQYLDDATGLYDLRARDYDPTSGRFTATDPIAVPTGMPYVAGYSYSYNNPMMFTDVSGNVPIGQFDCGGISCNAGVPETGTYPVSSSLRPPNPRGSLTRRLGYSVDGQFFVEATPYPCIDQSEAYQGVLSWGDSPTAAYMLAQGQLTSLRNQDTPAQRLFDSCEGTTAAEDAVLYMAVKAGAAVFNEGDFCGVYMVCIVNAGFAANGQDTFTTGRVVVTGSVILTPDTQAHEYGHVGEQLVRGYRGFMTDYGLDGAMKFNAGLRGDALHDGMVVEAWNNARQERYVRNPNMSLFVNTVYGPGTNPRAN